jgi:hypothetical protein
MIIISFAIIAVVNAVPYLTECWRKR